MSSTARKQPDIFSRDDVTVAEFVEFAFNTKGTRYQLMDGRVVAMAPPSVGHGTIQANLVRAIGRALDNIGSRCRIVTEPGVKPRSNARHNVRVPDLGVTCTKPAANETLLTEPVLLVEVLSPGNKANTWANVHAYQSIPTLREILIVASDKRHAKLFRVAPDGLWAEDAIEISDNGTIDLESIGIAITLADTYRLTHLGPEEMAS
jgi:Uma2 family endonuclease